MANVKITVVREEGDNLILTYENTFQTESNKRLTSSRAARALAQQLPCFRRRKGRYARFSGIEVLPKMEKTLDGWIAWRLHNDNNMPSGFEPPLPGRVGKGNSTDNPYSDRSSGVWERAKITEITE